MSSDEPRITDPEPRKISEPRPQKTRPSAYDPQKKLERRIPAGFTVFFYGFPALAAWVLLYNSDNPSRSGELWTVADPILTVGVAAGAIGVLLILRWVMLKYSRASRALESEFGWIIGRQKKWECILLALASGAAEEYFFRGWLQTTAGVWIAAAIFAALHWPVNKNYLLWPFIAFAAGVGFGWMTIWTGNLVAAAAAHAVYNGVALWRISDRFPDWNQKRADRYVETGVLE